MLGGHPRMPRTQASSLLPPSPHRRCPLRPRLCLGQVVTSVGSRPVSLLLGSSPGELVFTGMRPEPAHEEEDGSAQLSGVRVLSAPPGAQGWAAGPEWP